MTWRCGDLDEKSPWPFHKALRQYCIGAKTGMRWQQVILIGMIGSIATLAVIVWLVFQGVFDKPLPSPKLTDQQRQALHGDTVVGFDAYVAGDYERAIAYLLPRAQAGDHFAQYRVGLMYGKGTGVKENQNTSMDWYQLAAAAGNTKAIYNIGLRYFEGKDVPKDLVRAIEFWHRSASLGHIPSQNNLAVAYLKLEKTPEYHRQGIYWLTKAAESGSFQAQNSLAVEYLLGENIKRNPTHGFYWNQLAIGNGSLRAVILSPIFYMFTSRSERRDAVARIER